MYLFPLQQILFENVILKSPCILPKWRILRDHELHVCFVFTDTKCIKLTDICYNELKIIVNFYIPNIFLNNAEMNISMKIFIYICICKGLKLKSGIIGLIWRNTFRRLLYISFQSVGLRVLAQGRYEEQMKWPWPMKDLFLSGTLIFFCTFSFHLSFLLSYRRFLLLLSSP